MINFIHRFLNPHCPDCIQASECKSCETLRFALEQAIYEKKLLLDKLIHPVSEPESVQQEIKPINRGTVPWRVRQQILESEDREKARILRANQAQDINRDKEREESINELEREIGILESENNAK